MARARTLAALVLAASGLLAQPAWATHTVSTVCFSQNVQISGTDGVDNPLNGNDNPNVMAAGAGGDSIYGKDGADRICGDDGGDYIEGNLGNDYLTGNDGADWIQASRGDDNEVRGASDSDTVFGEEGADTTFGGAGIDHVYGGEEDDIIYDGPGTDYVSGQSGTDVWFHCYQSGVTDVDDGTIEVEFLSSDYC